MNVASGTGGKCPYLSGQTPDRFPGGPAEKRERAAAAPPVQLVSPTSPELAAICIPMVLHENQLTRLEFQPHRDLSTVAGHTAC